MGIEKFGTDAVELNTGTGGIVSADGLTLIDTGSSGETSLLLGPAVLREVQAGVANGTFSALPPDPDAPITDENPLPYWSWVPGAGISLSTIYDTGAASNSVLRFSIAAGTAVGDTATLTRFIPVPSSASRSFSFYAEATCDNGSVSSQATVQLTCQFYKVDQTTTTGTAFTSALYTFNDLATVIGITAPDIYVPGTGPDLVDTTAPADAAYLKLTITVKTAAIAVATVSRTLTTATVTTAAVHNFSAGQSVTVALTAGPTGYTALNGTWAITGTPTTTSFTFTTVTSGTITAGAATGTASVSIARSVDLTEVRVGNGTPEIILTDKGTPTNFPAYIVNDNNELSLWNGGQEGSLSIAETTTTLSATTTLDLYGGEQVAVDAGTIGFTVTSANAIDMTAAGAAELLGAPVTISSTTGDLLLTAEASDVIVRDSNVANGTNPRILFQNKSGTNFAGIKSGAANVIQILNGSSSTDYAQLWAERIYPMNGSTASRYIYDDGTRTHMTGGLDTDGSIVTNGSILNDSISTTTATANAAIWVLSSGTAYTLRRNSSSARYKTDITDADAAVLEAAKRVKARHYASTIEDEAGATRLGFIAEEVYDAGLTHAVGLDAEGRPETLDSTALIAALFVRIEDLEKRIAALEG